MMQYIVRGGIRKRVHKEYVDVLVRNYRDGRIEPVAVCWKDGRTFYVDQVLDVTGFGGMHRGRRTKTYLLRFGEHETELHMEHSEGHPGINDPEKVRWWVYAFDQSQKRGA